MTIKKNKLAISIEEFLNTRYKEYSEYVLYSRAIPSMIDGFKPSQRKLIYTADKVCKNSLIKCASLAGDVISKANYHHGNASLESAINVMVQQFKNNVPWFKGKGTFGSRLVPVAAAARYTYARMSPDFYKYFKDFEVTDSSPDPEDPEPTHYLPIIPTVLLNGISGIAVGFATEIQPRNPLDLANACVKYLNGENIDNLDIPPYYEGFKGTIVKSGSIHKCYGVATIQKRNDVKITELPIGHSRESYVETLNKLEDAGIIKSYSDRCSKVGFDFTVKLASDPKLLSNNELCELLKLTVNLNENLTVIDENGKLKLYDNIHPLIKDFCNYRITKYAERYINWYERDKEKKRVIDIKIQFINAVLHEKIVLKGKSKAEIKAMLGKTKLPNDLIDTLISMPLYSICKDGLDDLKAKSKELQIAMDTWKNIDCVSEYKKELKVI